VQTAAAETAKLTNVANRFLNCCPFCHKRRQAALTT
jgi:hypothetical protein